MLLISVLTIVLVTIGGLWLTYQLYKVASFTYAHFLHRSSLDRYKDTSGSKSTASWAVVTGASDGIGKGFAEELCHRGFNVVLHGRNEKKLNALRDQLLKQWPEREIEILVIDAANKALDAEAAVQQLKDLNLKILVNNVGGGMVHGQAWAALSESDAERVRHLIELNARFTTEITRLLLPQLTQHSPALILNIGSLACEVPLPYLSIYSGVKGYIKSWSSALALEMKLQRQDVEVKHVMVGMVSSASVPVATTLVVPSSRRMAQGTLDKVGLGSGVVYGYWPHELQHFVISSMPTWILNRVLLNAAQAEIAKEQGQIKAQ